MVAQLRDTLLFVPLTAPGGGIIPFWCSTSKVPSHIDVKDASVRLVYLFTLEQLDNQKGRAWVSSGDLGHSYAVKIVKKLWPLGGYNGPSVVLPGSSQVHPVQYTRDKAGRQAVPRYGGEPPRTIPLQEEYFGHDGRLDFFYTNTSGKRVIFDMTNPFFIAFSFVKKVFHAQTVGAISAEKTDTGTVLYDIHNRKINYNPNLEVGLVNP